MTKILHNLVKYITVHFGTVTQTVKRFNSVTTLKIKTVLQAILVYQSQSTVCIEIWMAWVIKLGFISFWPFY